MPRMIFWNVQTFNSDKFYGRKRKRKRDEEEEWGADVGLKYRDVLIRTITRNDPDFIVLAEIKTGGAQDGQLVADVGAVKLLAELRGQDPTWALVPPIVSGVGGRAEGVAVFFRRGTMFFTGPWRWIGQGAAAGGNAALYQQPYDTSFSRSVDDRTVPAGALHNAGQVERRLAGQTGYTVAGASAVFGVAGNRTPFRTTFYDSTRGRNYSILGFHAPPGQGDRKTVPVTNAPSTLGTAEVARLTEVANPGANEVVVVAGDFNVSLFDQAAIGVAYRPFLNAGYTRIINSNPLPDTYPAKGYLSTHLKGINSATVDSTRGGPALGYLSDCDQYGAWDSIDNAFVRNSTAPQTNATIANIVYGTPYDPNPNGMPIGHYTYSTVLDNPDVLGNNRDGWAKDNPEYDGMLDTFRESENYQRAYNVSDHLPLVFDFQ